MYFVTDTNESEIDILADLKHEWLLFKSVEGRSIKEIQPPQAGWSHEILEKAADSLGDRLDYGVDAYLGAQWVGSTEV